MLHVAIHIVTYNSATVIRACVEAARAQTAPHCRITLRAYDNASTDGTPDALAALDVPFTAGGQNLGYAGGHNTLIAQAAADPASYDYVLTLNPDVWLAPGYVAAMTAALESDSGLGMAAGRLLRVEQLGQTPENIDGLGLYMRRNRRQGLIGDSEPAENAPTVRREIFGPDGAAAFYRMAMLADISMNGGPFDADFFMHKEDIDLVWRARLRGWRALYVPDAIAHHVRSFRPGQRGRVNDDLRLYAVRNRYLLMLKNEIPTLFLRDLPFILAYEVAILGYIVLRERRSLRAYWAAVRAVRATWAKRRHIMAGRRATAREMGRWFGGNDSPLPSHGKSGVRPGS